jgi:hypothetical protein
VLQSEFDDVTAVDQTAALAETTAMAAGSDEEEEEEEQDEGAGETAGSSIEIDM